MSENNKEKKVTKKDIWKVCWRYILTFQWSWNYERMQALGFAWSILPVLEKISDTKEELIENVKRHLQFFNVHPPAGGAIIGAAAAMEAEKETPKEAVDSLKVGLMGPFSGIGDTLYAVLTRPILGVLAASLAMAGNIFGFWIMVLFGIAWGIVIKYYLFWLGYRQGNNVIDQAVDEEGEGLLDKITAAATVFGITVIGGFIPDILSGLTTPLTFEREIEVEGEMVSEVVEIQNVLDDILPYMIPIALVAICYYLIQKRDWSAVSVLILLFILGFAGSYLGLL